MGALDRLVRSLDLAPVAPDAFVGPSHDEGLPRVFGGLLAAQALVAAARTVEVGDVHALHVWFLRPGDPARPVRYDVARLRDGRSLAARQVGASQDGRALAVATASFCRPADGPDHALPMPAVDPPESLPGFAERTAPYAGGLGDAGSRPRPVDTRFVTPGPFERRPGQVLPPAARVWVRADGRLGDDPVLHAAVVAYASDLTVLDTIRLPHGISAENRDDLVLLTLNLALWFHRPMRADEWALYDQQSPSAWGGRGLARGSIFTAAGDLAVSVVQESLARWPEGSDEG